jgi:peptidyl-prolyl cis-trans isomerase SurA
LPNALAAQGIDYRDFRDDMRRDIALQLLRQRDVVSKINISPRELEQFLARQEKLPDQNAQYSLSHILISVAATASSEQMAAREARAKEAYDKIMSGTDFSQVAVAYSDSSTNVEGGSLGWRKGAELPSIVAELIPTMKAGDTTQPIRTPSGFHIFRLNEVRGGDQQAAVSQIHARHILLRTNDLEDDATVKQRL